jgi:fatty-acyl-CoA synthase
MVQLEPKQVLREDELIAFSHDQLAGYKRPRLFQFVAELPQTASGKIARREVQAQMENMAI